MAFEGLQMEPTQVGSLFLLTRQPTIHNNKRFVANKWKMAY